MDGHRLTVVPAQGSAAAASAVAARPRARLGEILCTRQMITTAQLEKVLSRQTTMAVRLGDLLRTETDLNEDDLLSALEHQWRSRRIDVTSIPPDPMLVQSLGFDTCLRLRLLPWRRIGGATVIAAVYPDHFEQERERLEALFGPIMLALCRDTDFRECLQLCFPGDVRRRNELRLPEPESCRAWDSRPFRIGSLGTIGAFATLVTLFPEPTFLGLTALALTALAALTTLKAAAGITALTRAPASAPGTNVVPLHPPTQMRRPVVSLLVPLYREDRIAEHLVKRLARIKYPEALLDICLIVESDDAITRTCLRKTALGPAFRVIGLEDARADEVAFGPELHHQSGVGRSGDASGAEQRHRQPAGLGDLLHQRQRGL